MLAACAPPCSRRSSARSSPSWTRASAGAIAARYAVADAQRHRQRNRATGSRAPSDHDQRGADRADAGERRAAAHVLGSRLPGRRRSAPREYPGSSGTIVADTCRRGRA